MSTTVKFAEMGYKEHNNFFEAVQAGEIICPEPILWNDFWKNFVKPIARRTPISFVCSIILAEVEETRENRHKNMLRAIMMSKITSRICLTSAICSLSSSMLSTHPWRLSPLRKPSRTFWSRSGLNLM